MRIVNTCGICKQAFKSNTLPQHPPRHCTNPQCNWCVQCVARKYAECRGK